MEVALDNEEMEWGQEHVLQKNVKVQHAFIYLFSLVFDDPLTSLRLLLEGRQ